MKVHGNDFESLYKEISKDVLPKEYGGAGPTLDELTSNSIYLNKLARFLLFLKPF